MDYNRARVVTSKRTPVAAVDVYVDDFILMAQTLAQRQRVLRATLGAIDDVFRPLSADDPPGSQITRVREENAKGGRALVHLEAHPGVGH